MSKDRVRVPQVMQMEAVECGAASLAMILAYYERWVPLDKIREDCGVGRDGTSIAGILGAALEYGLDAEEVSLSIDELKDKKPFPCIIQWNYHHFVVLTGIRGKYVYINDPGKGTIRYPMQVFEKSYHGIAMTFMPNGSFEKGGSKPSSFRYVLKRIKGLKAGIAAVLVTSALASIATVIINITVAHLVSRKRVDITRTMSNGYGKLVSTELSGIEMIETLKSAGAENAYFKRWAGIHTNVTSADIKLCWLNETMGFIPSLLTEITNIVVSSLGVKLIIEGQFTPGTLLAFMGLLTAFTKPVNEMITMGQTIQEMQVQMERVEDVMNNPVDVEENTKDLTDEEWENISKLKGDIEFKNITFGYSNRSKPLIENMSIKIAAGAMLYVVVEELIPEMSVGEHSNVGVLTFAVGFSLMMALDVALG